MNVRAGALAGLAVLAALVFAAMWVGWTASWPWLAGIDSSTLAAAHRVGVEHHAWVTAWNGVCTVFSPLVLRLVAVGLIGYALIRRQRSVALFLLVCAVLSGPLTEIVKGLARRPRPDTALVQASSTSFPSGHALGDMACVLALIVVAWPHLRPALRPVLIAAGVAIVLAVGVGRVALNVHHASDVLAGWALGYVWFVLCLPLLTPAARLTAADRRPAARDTGH